MSQLPASIDPAIIQLLIAVVVVCIGFINAISFFILKRIKKNIDELQARGRADHDRIIVLETKQEFKERDINGK